MGRYEVALIAGIATALCVFFVVPKHLLGAEELVGFRMQRVPIFCGPAKNLRDKLLESQSKTVFSGNAFGGTFLIFQKPPPSQEFMVTYWRQGSGCVIASGTGAQVYPPIQWTMREEDGDQKTE